MNTKKRILLLLLFTLYFSVFSIAIAQTSSSSTSSGKKAAQTANKSAVPSKGYMTKAEFVAYVEKELAKIKDIDLDMSDENKEKLATGFYESLGISSIQNKPEKLSKNDFISSELSKARNSKDYVEKSAKIEKDADKLYSVKKKGDPISVDTKTGKHYEGKFYGKTSSYITVDDHRVPLIDLSQDSLDLFSESAMSKKRADYVRREKQRLLPDTYELNESYKKVESEASKKSFKKGYILSNGEWESVKTLAVSVINTSLQTKKELIAKEAEQKRRADEAEQKRIAKETAQKRNMNKQERLVEEALQKEQQKRIAEAEEQKRLAEEAAQKRKAEAAKWKQIAEESEAELKNDSAFYDKELEKNVPLIRNGPKQNITSDMNYEELDHAIYMFTSECEICEVAKELLPSFYVKKGYFSTVEDYQDIRRNESLSYKEKKILLIKYYDEVIKHIKEVYSLPLKQWEDKCLSENSRSRFEWNGILHNCCCEWHATALAQRGSAEAQYQLGISVLDPRMDRDSLEENITWLKHAGENGVPKAYYVLGKASYNADNYKAAIDWYKRGAEKNQVDCLYELGNIACELKNPSAALTWYARASDLGHVSATLACAQLCENNYEGFRADYKKSIEYYKKLIEMEKKNLQKDGLSYDNSYEIEKYNKKIKELELKIED